MSLIANAIAVAALLIGENDATSSAAKEVTHSIRIYSADSLVPPLRACVLRGKTCRCC